MITRLCITAVAFLAISSAAFAQSTPTADPAKSAAGRTSADCEKMSGAARATCMSDLQAADGKAKKPSTGGTAGSGSTGSGTAAQPSQTPPSTGGAASGAYGK
ncbi:MAG: hypothetical protein ACXWCY_12125 [Burkholderiales bacterium]